MLANAPRRIHSPVRHPSCVGWTEALRFPLDGGWPLPTAGGRRHVHLPTTALVCTVRPNLSSAVGSEDKDKQAYVRPECPVSSHRRLACLRPLGASSSSRSLVPRPRRPAGAAPLPFDYLI